MRLSRLKTQRKPTKKKEAFIAFERKASSCVNRVCKFLYICETVTVLCSIGIHGPESMLKPSLVSRGRLICDKVGCFAQFFGYCQRCTSHV